MEKFMSSLPIFALVGFALSTLLFILKSMGIIFIISELVIAPFLICVAIYIIAIAVMFLRI